MWMIRAVKAEHEQDRLKTDLGNAEAELEFWEQLALLRGKLLRNYELMIMNLRKENPGSWAEQVGYNKLGQNSCDLGEANRTRSRRYKSSVTFVAQEPPIEQSPVIKGSI